MRFFRWLFGPSKKELLAEIDELKERLFDLEQTKQQMFRLVESSVAGDEIRNKFRSVDFGPVVETAVGNYIGKLIGSIDLKGTPMPVEVKKRVVNAIEDLAIPR